MAELTRPVSSNVDGFSDEKAALYDRQLRLWGVDVQKKVGDASVLVVRCGPTMAELSKNMVLAGVGKLTVCDERARMVTTQNRGSIFLLSSAPDGGVGMKYADATLPHLQSLSPYTELSSLLVDSFRDLDAQLLAQFDIIVATDLPFSVVAAINDAARKASRPFFAARSIGSYGYVFADLGDAHEYVARQPVPASGSQPTSVGPVSGWRKIIRVEPEEQSANSDPEEQFERVVTQDRYVSFRHAVTEQIPASLIRQARRQSRHESARGDGPTDGTAPAAIATDWLAAVKFLALLETGFPGHEALPSSLPAAVLAEARGGILQDGFPMFSASTLGLPDSVRLPKELLTGPFWKMYEAANAPDGDLAPHSRSSPSNAARVISTASCLGGTLAEQLISFVGRKEPVLQNLLLFDGESFAAPVVAMIGQLTGPDASSQHASFSKPAINGKGKEVVVVLDD